MALTKCKECGHEISKSAKSCPNCGHKVKSGGAKNGFVGLFVVLVIVFFMSAGDDSDSESSSDEAALSQLTVPESQSQFVAAAQRAQQAAPEADNDMAKGGVRAERAEAVCQALSGDASVNNWVGEIEDINSNSEGRGVLAVSLADRVTVTTWNNAMSDIGSNTLIEPNTELFNTVSAMKKGDLVEISGRFFADDVDCVSEQSLTLDGSLRAPEYTMKFESVAAYSAD